MSTRRVLGPPEPVGLAQAVVASHPLGAVCDRDTRPRDGPIVSRVLLRLLPAARACIAASAPSGATCRCPDSPCRPHVSPLMPPPAARMCGPLRSGCMVSPPVIVRVYARACAHPPQSRLYTCHGDGGHGDVGAQRPGRRIVSRLTVSSSGGARSIVGYAAVPDICGGVAGRPLGAMAAATPPPVRRRRNAGAPA